MRSWRPFRRNPPSAPMVVAADGAVTEPQHRGRFNPPYGLRWNKPGSNSLRTGKITGSFQKTGALPSRFVRCRFGLDCRNIFMECFPVLSFEAENGAHAFS